jgi:hypothetical protein
MVAYEGGHAPCLTLITLADTAGGFELAEPSSSFPHLAPPPRYTLTCYDGIASAACGNFCVKVFDASDLFFC